MERLNTLLLYILPHHLLSRAMYHLARLRLPWLKNGMIRLFVKHFAVDLTEAEIQRPEDFPHFNAFFTRALKPGVRPLAEGKKTLICPVDGRVSQCGALQAGRLIQAKGLDYTLDDLLGGPLPGCEALAEHGVFATLYLSPRDYHRIHMPLAGRPRRLRYIPGRLFSVNAWSTEHVPGLFTRNERAVILFDTAAGPLVLVMVGAIFVGTLETAWTGELHPTAGAGMWEEDYDGEEPLPALAKGAELGRFNMGSTVIVLADGRRLTLDERLAPGRAVRLGEALGRLADSVPAEAQPIDQVQRCKR